MSRFLPSVLAALLLGLAGCGASGAVTNPDPTPAAEPSDSEAPVDAPALREVDGTIRIVNLYTPKGGAEGSTIDVWAGTQADGGKKLATVAYGEVSEELTPLSANEEYDGTTQFHVNFFPAGKTSVDDMLGGLAEFSAPGLKLTMALLAGDEGELGGARPLTYVDDPGERPENAGPKLASFPEVPAGKAVLLTTAVSVMNAYDAEGFPPHFVYSTADGVCTPFIQTPRNVEDPATFDETGDVGAEADVALVVDPGTDLTLRPVANDGSHDEACKSGKVLTTVTPDLEPGQRAYAFVHGVTGDAIEALVVPAMG